MKLYYNIYITDVIAEYTMTSTISTKMDSPSERHFELKYPNAFVLDYDTYYEDMRYNATRRCKLILFAQCLGQNEQLMYEKRNNEVIKNKRIATVNEITNGCVCPAYNIKDAIIPRRNKLEIFDFKFKFVSILSKQSNINGKKQKET